MRVKKDKLHQVTGEHANDGSFHKYILLEVHTNFKNMYLKLVLRDSLNIQIHLFSGISDNFMFFLFCFFFLAIDCPVFMLS